MMPTISLDPHTTLYFFLIFGIDDIFIALALMAASALLQALITKAPARPANATPVGIEAFDIPQIKEGTPQIVIFGDVWLTDWQVLWYGNLRSEGITKSTGGGKK